MTQSKLSFINDFFIPFRTIALVFSSGKLFFYSFLPSFITLLVIIFTVGPIWDWAAGLGAAWTFWGAGLARAITAFFTSVAYCAVIWMGVGNILIIPFIDAILNTAQRRTAGNVFLPGLPLNLVRIIKEGALSAFMAMTMLFAMFLAFIPGIGLILSIAISMYCVGFLTLQPMFERLELPFGERRQRLHRRLPNFLAYGFGLWILLYIPGLNVIFLGLAQASAVPFWQRHRDVLEGKI